MKSITEQGVGLYLACGYVFGAVLGGGSLLKLLKLICFVVLEDGWGGWLVFCCIFFFFDLLVLGSGWHARYSLTSPTKSMKSKFMKIVRTQGWVMGHRSRT